MKKQSKPSKNKASLREKIIGLGERSTRKSYYPQLQEELKQLEEAKKRAEENEEKFRALYKNIADGILVVDIKSRKFHASNNAICRMLGYSQEEILKLGVKDIHSAKDLPYVVEQFEKLVKREITIATDIPVKRKDGSIFYADIHASPLTLTGKEYIMGVFRDITERKRIEEALQKAKEFSDSLIDSIQDGFSVLDRHGVHINVNPALCQMTGLSKKELIGTGTPHPYWPPEEYKKIEKAFRKTLKGEFTDFELIFMRKNGERFPVVVSPSWIKDEQGNVISYLATIEDISERKRLEEILKKERQELKLIIDSSPIIVFYKDKEGKFIRVNKTFAEVLNMPEEDFLGKTVFDLYSAKIAQGMTNDDQDVLKSGLPKLNIIEQYESASGIRWVQTDKIPICDKNGIPVGLIGFAQDVTERKKAEQKILRLNKLYSVLSKTADIILHIRDLKTLYIEACRIAVEEMLLKMAWIGFIDQDTQLVKPFAHYGFDEGYLDNIRISINPDIPEGRGPTGTAIRGGKHVICNDIANDSRMLPWRDEALKRGYRSSIAFPLQIRDRIVGSLNLYAPEPNSFEEEEKEMNLFETLATDISFAMESIEHEENRKRAEEALRESETRFRQLFENMSGAVAVYEARDNGNDFIFKDFNRAGEMIENIKKEKLIGKSVLKIFPRVKEFGLFEIFQRVWRTGKSEHHPISLYKDNRIAGWRENYVYKLPTGEIVAVYDDITERKQMEKELKRSHEMKVLGQIAAGVAHEVRNPLNAILSITEALFQDIGDNPEYTPYLEHIRNNVDRLSMLMKNLLELGKPIQTTNFQRELLTEICKATINLWNASELSKKHALRFVSHPHSEKVYVNTESLRLQQCFLNLLENAAQNSPEGSEILLHLLEPKGQIVKVHIIDRGTGIPPDNLKHLFKPFFTTRKGGTGLGLSLVKHFVESMGGKVAIWNNDPPPGCTVEVTLQIAKDSES